MEGHLDEDERDSGNRKNGKSKKLLKTSSGNIEVSTPRDRLSSFEPEIVKKRETIMAQTLEDKIIGLYSLGTSLRDISAHIKETYDTDISAATLSAITDKVIPLVKEWQQRPLEELYCIVWLDAMYYKVKEEGRTMSLAASCFCHSFCCQHPVLPHPGGRPSRPPGSSSASLAIAARTRHPYRIKTCRFAIVLLPFALLIRNQMVLKKVQFLFHLTVFKVKNLTPDTVYFTLSA
jgi:hypothetical protein